MIIKVIEIIAQSEKSWEDAVHVALHEASKTVKNIKSIYIQEMQAIVESNAIAHYRLNAKVSFVIDEGLRNK
jgi:flavin-binding protein dodecin